MLRITRLEDSLIALRLSLDGRLVGAWVDLLDQELAWATASGQKVQLELSGLQFANEHALAVLRRALQSGAELVRCPPLISALLGDSGHEGL